MYRKLLFWLMSLPIIITSIFSSSLQSAAYNAPTEPIAFAENEVQPEDAPLVEVENIDYSSWFIVDETSKWKPEEMVIVEQALSDTFAALDSVGLDGSELFAGYHFRRYAGEFAKDKEGKIALANYNDQEIILADTVFLPENIFYIYHELGHVLDHQSNRVLNDQFHALTLQIEGVTTLHEWTTAQGFFLRGQAHVSKTEGTADAFALWVFVDFASNPVPHFKNMPENGNPEAIIEVFEQALEITFGV